MSTNLSSVPKLQFFDANGNPLAGGKLYTYAAGTTTPLATYTDSTGLTPNTNPIILDSRGEANVWLDATQYKFELTTAADALIWTVDNISNALNLSQLLASSGSAASPPYTFAADTTTGMFLAAAGQIGLSASGTPVFRSTDTQAVLDVNLQISGTARRITGDFSNATFADRVMFQTSTTNGNTLVATLPNGTSNISGFQVYANSSGITDVPFGQFAAFSTEVAVSSARNGTGVYLPMTFYTGGSERVRVDTSGNVGIGTSSPGEKFVVLGNASVDIYKLRANTSAPSSTDAFIYRPADNTLGFGTASTEHMRIISNGNVAISPVGGLGNARLYVQGSSTSGSDYALYIDNTNGFGPFVFSVANNGTLDTGLQLGSPYNNTTANAANAHINSSGVLQRSTSSLRYKTDVQDASHGLQELLRLRSVTYAGKNDPEKTFGGFIAEEVHEAGLTEFVEYDKNDQPDALAYGNMVSLCVKAIQEQQAVIEQLTQRIAALEQA